MTIDNLHVQVYLMFVNLDQNGKLCWSTGVNRLVGLVVKASASRAEGPGFESR